jgi:peptidoglycan/LPS O-acetylase OafA/YrhL
LLIFNFFDKNNKLTIFQCIFNVVIALIGIISCYLLTYNDNVVFHPELLRGILKVLTALSIFVLFIPIEFIQSLLRNLLKPFIKTGRFSYAIYIFHWPFIILLRYYFEDFIKLQLSYMLIVILFNALLVFFIAWYAEVKLQPKIVRLINNKFYKSKYK